MITRRYIIDPLGIQRKSHLHILRNLRLWFCIVGSDPRHYYFLNLIVLGYNGIEHIRNFAHDFKLVVRIGYVALGVMLYSNDHNNV